MPRTWYWGSSSSGGPYRTTGFTQNEGVNTYSVALPSDAVTDINGDKPIRILDGTIYLDGYGTGSLAASTGYVRIGGTNSAGFSLTKRATTSTTGATIKGPYTVTGATGYGVYYNYNSQTTATVGFDCNGDVFLGRWGTSAPGTDSIWGRSSYIVAPGAPTSFSVSDQTSTSFVVTVGGETGTADGGGLGITSRSYDVYTDSGFSNAVATDVSSGSAVTGLSPGTTYYLRGRNSNGTFTSRNTTGLYTATTTAVTTRIATFYYQNGTGGSASRTGYSNSFYEVTTPSAPSYPGYTFNHWGDSSGNFIVNANTSWTVPYDGYALYARWTLTQVTPVWSTTSVDNATLGKSYSFTVSASNATDPIAPYTLYSGALPPGLSLNAFTGLISGTPTSIGTYSFVIRAKSSTGNTADSTTLQIIVAPAGRRSLEGETSALTNAKRFNGSEWVNLTVMKRFDGSGWVNITNS